MAIYEVAMTFSQGSRGKTGPLFFDALPILINELYSNQAENVVTRFNLFIKNL